MRGQVNTDSIQRVFHRAPRHVEPEPSRPRREPYPDEPVQGASPPWSAVITGIATGAAIATVTGHWYIALFSIVTGTVSGLLWLVRIVQHRRRMKFWRSGVTEVDERFDEACRRCAGDLADRRRSEHPSLKDIELEIRMGGHWFWHSRRLDQICIGSGRRGISVTDGAPVVAFDDIPLLVDISPGEMVGIHGRRAVSALRAMIARMAARVGPSDWNLTVVGELHSSLCGLTHLPHFGQRPTRRHQVVLTFDVSLLKRHAPVMRAFEHGDTSVIVVASTLHELPAGCTTIIDSEDDDIDGLGSGSFEDVCRSIASWSDPDLEDTGIPHEIRFADLVSGGQPTLDQIHATWEQRRGCGPCFALGVDAHEIVHLELDRDGPHVVIVGTTGSGKSEVLRQIVMSMAWNSSPLDLNLVLIDYKGGAAFDVCSELPHVAGVITDLDEGLANRVLVGLEFELKRRESVLRDARVSDVNELSRSQNSATRSDTLARLVVVIDELAALREDEPEFVPALAAIAQRGRSLGLYLVVATQRPPAVTADVMGNSSVRIALRVQTAGDSIDVVGSDRAAHIGRNIPGRLILKVGSDEIREVQAVRVCDVLADLVDLVTRAAAPCQRPLQPWSTPLPDRIERSHHVGKGVVGVVDDFRHQRQEQWSCAFDGNVSIVGGLGRTNALRTIARSISRGDSHVDIVIISCRPSHGLGLERFGVPVDAFDHERFERVLTLWRKRSSASTAGTPHEHRLVVMIDDIDVLYERVLGDRVLMRQWESFEQLLSSSSPSHVLCVVTMKREQSVPASTVAHMSSVWKGTRRAGMFQMWNRSGGDGDDVQMFWEEPDSTWSMSSDPSLEAELAVLPAVVQPIGGEFAIHADDRAIIEVHRNEPLRFAVIGPRDSGVSSAIAALVRSWRVAHPSGCVIDVSLLDEDADPQTEPSWSEVLAHDGPSLIVVDDVHRRPAQRVARVLDEPSRWGLVSIIVGVAPTFVRTRPEHWIQNVRRSRTGVLLGPSIDEDFDLFGLHTPPLSVHRVSAGRGLWVEGGASRGIIQFVIVDSQ